MPIQIAEQESKAKPTLDANGPSTRCVHAGESRQKVANAITDVICCSSTYTFESTQSVIDFIEQKQSREEYGRYGSPNEKVVEAKLADLDNAEEAVVFASGMAAAVGLVPERLATRTSRKPPSSRRCESKKRTLGSSAGSG